MKNGEKETLCWSYERACGQCSWSQSFAPVDGWTAQETRLNYSRTWSRVNGDTFYRKKMERSYVVKACPLYVPDGKDKRDTLKRMRERYDLLQKLQKQASGLLGAL